MYGSYGIAFDGACFCSFDNDFARNIVIFGVDNSLSSHADNRKNNFLVLSEGPTDYINGSLGAAERKFSIIFSKAKIKLCLGLHCEYWRFLFVIFWYFMNWKYRDSLCPKSCLYKVDEICTFLLFAYC